MNKIPESLSAFKKYDQWVLWKIVNGKKLPFSPTTLKHASSVDPSTWSNAQTVETMAELLNGEYNIGFVFTELDPFYFLDLDKCIQSDNTWSPVANNLMTMLSGAAIEVSQSNTGLHIFGSYDQIPNHKCKNISLGLELYHTSRFVALTGSNIVGSAGCSHAEALSNIITQYFPTGDLVTPTTWTTEPHADWSGLTNDDELINKALASKSAASAFGTRSSFKDLWTREVTVLSDVFSPDTADAGEFDESSADAALAQHLAFWTGNNCERISKLMFKSALVRDKWNRRHYIPNTILRAVGLQTEFHTTKRKEPPRIAVEPTEVLISSPIVTEGYQFLGITQQIDFFKGCCYVQDIHKIFTPSGALLNPERFNASYGGYSFQLEADASGRITRKAWEAYTESHGVRYPKAESTCFKPQLPSGSIIQSEGRSYLNTYKPINIPKQEGDITPFLNHLNKLLPNPNDRDILLAYMAAIVQYPGVKFQWAPLIQGVEGNGKTLFTYVVAYAVGRIYTHMPRAQEISEKFNAWMFDRIFIGIEDIYVPEHKSEILEILKPMITAKFYERRDMGVVGKMYELICNFIFNSNYKDAVRKTSNDRRFSIFYTAQQLSEDIIRDGMGGSYFPDLYQWLEKGGYANVAHYLGTYEIPEALNPAGACHRAPETTSTNEAIHSGLGSIEQEVLEAVDEGRQGFAGGWISSMALERLLDDRRMSRLVPRNKRRTMLQALGYDWHPGLHDGRSGSLVMVDGGKPRLFIKKGHVSCSLQGNSIIIDAYSKAQSGTLNTASRAFSSDYS